MKKNLRGKRYLRSRKSVVWGRNKRLVNKVASALIKYTKAIDGVIRAISKFKWEVGKETYKSAKSTLTQTTT